MSVRFGLHWDQLADSPGGTGVNHSWWTRPVLELLSGSSSVVTRSPTFAPFAFDALDSRPTCRSQEKAIILCQRDAQSRRVVSCPNRTIDLWQLSGEGEW